MTSGVILTLYDWLNTYVISVAFPSHFMALTINAIDRLGPGNEIHRELQLSMTKVMLY